MNQETGNVSLTISKEIVTPIVQAKINEAEQIKKAVEEELKTVISESSVEIRKALIAQLKSNKGANKVADAIINGLSGTFSSAYRSSISITFDKQKD